MKVKSLWSYLNWISISAAVLYAFSREKCVMDPFHKLHSTLAPSGRSCFKRTSFIQAFSPIFEHLEQRSSVTSVEGPDFKTDGIFEPLSVIRLIEAVPPPGATLTTALCAPVRQNHNIQIPKTQSNAVQLLFSH